MDSLIIYFLPTILALGIVTSYEDVKEGKIRNKYVVAGLVVSITIHTILLLSGIIEWKYMGMMAVQLLAALFIGVAIWITGLWSPGDAKLFAIFASLTPLTVHINVDANFPPLALLTNTVLPIFAYLVVILLVKTNTKQKLLITKKIMKPGVIINILLSVFALGWLTNIILTYFGITTNYLLSMTGIVILAAALRKIAKEKTNLLLAILAAIRIALDYRNLTTIDFLAHFLIITLSYSLVRLFLTGLSEAYTEEVSIYRLKEGMTLAEAITKQGTKTGMPKRIWQMDFDDAGFFLKTRDGLSRKDIERIKRAHREGRLHFNSIRIQQTLSFAPFLFAGTMITILLGENLLSFLMEAI